MKRSPGRRIWNRVEYLALRAAIGLLNLVPDRVAEAAGAALGRLGYWPLRIRRSQAEDNVRRAFPDRDETWVQRVVRSSYEHLGREAVVILRLPSKSPAQILARTRVIGMERAIADFNQGRGLVVCAGHFGNWEMGAAMIPPRGFPVDAIVTRQQNPHFDRYIVSTRQRLGIGIIHRGGATEAAGRALRAGRAVAFAADQNANRPGVFVPFFGRLAATHRGAALLAVRTGAPMYLALPTRQADGTYVMRLEEVFFEREGALEDVVWRGTAAFTAMLEAAIREAPEQYLWQHRRWKTRPPEERNPPQG
ncbi:MAG: lysophospholipid acyltransferase family protein [Gemmatimonadetes bacterium]|nr:lysophospholipid acyltransferase family protein [Gemmatimonadota bacterium]